MPSTANVGAGKPRVAGGIFVAPKGTTLPTDCTTALDAAFKNLGYISEDGVTNGHSPSVESTKEWGGAVINDSTTERHDTWKYKMMEVNDINVLKEIYGEDNVTGTLSTGITIKAKSQDLAEKVYVIETIIKGVAKRIVIPLGQITEIADIVYKGSELMGYEVTISAHLYTSASDTTGSTHYEYIKTA